MPEWNPPISLPRFTDEEFEKKQAEYVAKEGYYVTVPKLRDIIHIGTPPEPKRAEFFAWRDGSLNETNPWRYRQITKMVQDKRRRRNSSLASPIPTWGRNVASVLTFMDDINDTLGSAGVLLRFAARLAPRALGRVLLGPVGWLFLAADIAGLILDLMRLPFTCLPIKRTLHGVADLNPFSKQSRTRRARKMRRLLPGKGELIELAQTTDNIWGIGLCLGPIIGFAYDSIAGTYRALAGQKVTFFKNPPGQYKHEKQALRTLRDVQIAAALQEIMTEEEHLAMMLALSGAAAIVQPYIQLWNPLDQVQGLQYAEIRAPAPEYPTTLFVLEEKGIDPRDATGWPGLDKEFATIEELWDYNQVKAADALMSFAVRNRQNYIGSTGCQHALQFGLHMQHMIEGPGTVDVEYTDDWQGWNNYLSTGCRFTGAKGGYRYSCDEYYETTHRLGDQMLRVSGCMRGIGFPYSIKALQPFPLKSRDCTVGIGKEWCAGPPPIWVNGVHVDPLDEAVLEGQNIVVTGPFGPGFS